MKLLWCWRERCLSMGRAILLHQALNTVHRTVYEYTGPPYKKMASKLIKLTIPFAKLFRASHFHRLSVNFSALLILLEYTSLLCRMRTSFFATYRQLPVFFLLPVGAWPAWQQIAMLLSDDRCWNKCPPPKTKKDFYYVQTSASSCPRISSDGEGRAL